MNLASEARALFVPAFNLERHLSHSAEVRSFDLTAWVRQRQPINVVRSTCKMLRRAI
jgi:hypothetical protein